jgi:hypothetical protein
VEPLDKIEGLVLVPEEESQSSTCGDLLQRGWVIILEPMLTRAGRTSAPGSKVCALPRGRSDSQPPLCSSPRRAPATIPRSTRSCGTWCRS